MGALTMEGAGPGSNNERLILVLGPTGGCHDSKTASDASWSPKYVTLVPRIRSLGLSYGLKTILTLFGLVLFLQLLQLCVLLEYNPPLKSGDRDFSLVLPLSSYGLANPWAEEGPLLSGQQQGPQQPLLIPRIIHQTYKDERVPVKLLPLLESWTKRNPGWQRRFYTDQDCTRFVQEEFPQYYTAYRALPKDVERADFFRYMIVLRYGGVYADIDVESRRPLESFILPSDTMVVGWEAEAPNDVEAFNHHYVRKRQVLQWFFAATPGHPVLRAMCDHIANNMFTTFSNNTNIDTLERTGPGPWTDFVLRHALQEQPGLHTKWPIRIMPRISFGAHPAGRDGLNKASPQVAVFHHFWGSWKHKHGWHQRRTVLQLLYLGFLKARCAMSPAACGTWPQKRVLGGPDSLPASGAQAQQQQQVQLYPVDAAFNPPFTIMVNLVGQGDTQFGYDVSAGITSWGFWQVNKGIPSPPLVVDALIGALNISKRHTLIDVSSGLGFFSLAAAARGFKAIAFEASPRSLEPFVSSIRYNGFQDRVRLYNVSLGARPEGICTVRMPPALHDGNGSGGSSHHGQSQVIRLGRASRLLASSDVPSASPYGSAGADASYDTEAMRGYASPDLHSTPQAGCARFTSRETLDRMLRVALSEDGVGGGGSQGSAGAEPGGWGGGVGAMRLSANGWEGWVLEGAGKLMTESPPGVVLLEYSPRLIAASGYAEPSLLLYRLLALGYKSAAHAGTACDKRLASLPAEPQTAGAAGRPTWCKLTPDVFDFVTKHLYTQRTPENIFFIHESFVPAMDAAATAAAAHSAAQASSHAGSAVAAAAAAAAAATSRGTGVGAGAVAGAGAGAVAAAARVAAASRA